ncbi:MAG TPA: hypothetical protein VNQ79_17545 [Blastocatellia bacterium]|nr:hypothetical protein [Blastocatellia bacterium]
MSKARLIKRNEVTEQQEKEERRAASQPSVFQATMESVVRWAREKRRIEPPNAREKFAALFAQPQPE